MFKIPYKLICLCLLSTVAVGCGGDGEGSADGSGGEEAAKGSSATGSQSAITKSQFLNEAETICSTEGSKVLKETSAYLEARGSDYNSAEGPVLADAIQEVVVPALRAQIEQLRSLQAPPGDEDRVSAFLDALQGSVEEAAVRPPSSTKEFQGVFARPRQLGQAYGFKACAYGS
jgi:hypothetical protein